MVIFVRLPEIFSIYIGSIFSALNQWGSFFDLWNSENIYSEQMLIDLLKNILENPLPGSEAQKIMAPSSRFVEEGPFDKSSARESSVLIMLFPKGNEWHIPLIKRTEYKGVHSGQISLPGGKCEQEDNDFWDTATRETKEEIGVDSNRIRFLGKLTPLYIPKSNYMVFPQVGWLPQRPLFIPEPAEVDSIIEFPVARLVDSKFRKVFTNRSNGISFSAPFFDAGSHRVWGATAMILSELAEAMRLAGETITASHFYNVRNAQGYL